ncbi:MAG: YidC/Oxa1 family membrane protein insertase [Firmicutes bacterium]|nr:YidC/Oxa1 family membrane protein insertase [Bacillota bacterium]
MTITQMLYQLLIGPLQLLFEVVYVVAYRVIHHPALAIVALSLVMNVLVLPLYRQADALQAKERDKEMAIKPRLDKLKKAFSGDERFMVLQTFYRQNDYKPTDSLKGSISLLLEIPFFIAAYNFLSHLESLNNVSLGPIKDLGSPDGLLTLGGMSVNVLPILMTTINVISAAIYMKGFPLRSKVQMYGIAGIFLVFLYNSPAGLVFYWTLNNLFSLFKNIFYKLKNAEQIIKILISAAGLIMLAIILFVYPMRSARSQLVMIVLLLAMQFPMVSSIIKRKMPERNVRREIEDAKGNNIVFTASCISLTVLTGLLIPSSVLKGNILEFTNGIDGLSPLWYLVSAFIYAMGTFIIWFGIFYKLANPLGKKVLSIIVAALAVFGTVNYMFFGTDFGNLSPELKYDDGIHISKYAIIVNSLIGLVILGLVYLCWRKKNSIVKLGSVVLCLAIIAMFGLNAVPVMAEASEARALINAGSQDEPRIRLSKTGKNVIVIMMDKQNGYLVPFLINEKPELKEQFDGFTFYPNTASYGDRTNIGTPGLYGGYDYIPEEMNKRSQELLVNKHNEALKVMPAIFGDAGYTITLCDPTYAGYTWVPTLSVFDDHPEYNCYITKGRYPVLDGDEVDYLANIEGRRLRNFFCYSIFKSAPSIVQNSLYEYGNYNSSSMVVIKDEEGYKTVNTSGSQITDGLSKGVGFEKSFMEAYGVLCNLPLITETSEDNNTFTLLGNDTAHDRQMLKEPEYIPAKVVDNTEFDKDYLYREDEFGRRVNMNQKGNLLYYQINMAAMLKLGDWFDYLRENDVYDNTRIILVSDHGCSLYHDDLLGMVKWQDDKGESKAISQTLFNCVLLVKDFDAHGFTTNDEIHTNADTPAFAIDGLVDNNRNPFTGNMIRYYDGKPIHVQLTSEWSTENNNGNVFAEGDWFEIDGEVTEPDNWAYLGTW